MILRWPGPTSNAGPPRGRVDESHVVELRDIFPTFLDVAGAMGSVPKNHTLQGASLLPLIFGDDNDDDDDDDEGNKKKNWRPWIDLEHSTCYNVTNHWNALTDGMIKYIFNAFSATEQLFNLTVDPYELQDLSSNASFASELAKWRLRLVEQFEREKRGQEWVKDGKLQRRTEGQVYSPNYPT